MKVTLFEAVHLLSNTLGLIDPYLTNHHKHVAYIAVKIASKLGLSSERLHDLLIAGLLHDIGAIYQSERKNMVLFDSPATLHHPQIGYLLLRGFVHTRNASKIILHHHLNHTHSDFYPEDTREVSFESKILFLADRIDILFKSEGHVLGKMRKIREVISRTPTHYFDKDAIEAFMEVSSSEAFWLDLYEMPIVIRDISPIANIILRPEEVLEVAKICASIIDFRSTFTATHSVGVSTTAAMLAKLMGYSEERCMQISIAGYFHDIGKLKIPMEILEKKGALEGEEIDIIRSHSYYSYNALSVISGLKNISSWASEHHEKLTGNGYPFKLKPEDISDESKIMMIADIYTALIEDRPYREGISRDKAIELIGGMVGRGELCGKVFDVLSENRTPLGVECLKAQSLASDKYQELRNLIWSF